MVDHNGNIVLELIDAQTISSNDFSSESSSTSAASIVKITCLPLFALFWVTLFTSRNSFALLFIMVVCIMFSDLSQAQSSNSIYYEVNNQTDLL